VHIINAEQDVISIDETLCGGLALPAETSAAGEHHDPGH
jgi:hypothetical protein